VFKEPEGDEYNGDWKNGNFEGKGVKIKFL